jgi:hypothetical protein
MFEANPTQLAITNYLNGLGKWFYADFLMAYDVCTCLYESTLWIEVNLLSTAQVNLKGSITGTTTPIANISQTSGSVTDDGFSVKEILPDLGGAGKKAQKAYKTANEFTTSVEKALGINNKTDGELTSKQLETRGALGQLKSELTSANFLKKGLKAYTFLAIALELVESFTGGGKASAGTNTPMALNATMSLSGTITSAFQYRNIFFYTPGSLNAANKSPDRYPYYNEVLGVFNLLTSPKVFFKNPYPYTRWDFQLATPSSNGFEYVINPAAGFDLPQSEILGNLKLKQVGTVVAESGWMPLEALRNYKTYFPTGSIVPNRAELEIFLNLKRINSLPNDQNVLIKATYNIEMVQNEAFTYSELTMHPGQRDLIIENQVLATNKTAWNSVTIKPNTTLVAGANVNLTASSLANNYSTSIMQPSSSRLSEFCNAPVYRDHPFRNPANLRAKHVTEAEEAAEKSDLFVYPNPAASSVTFRYHNQTDGHIKLSLHNITNTQIAVIIDDEVEGGLHEVGFDSSHLIPGVYLCILETEISREVKRLVIIR